MPLTFTDPERPELATLDACWRAQAAAIELLARGGSTWDGKFLVVPFESTYRAVVYRVVRGAEHVYDAWIYGGGLLVVFAAGGTTPVAWDYEGIDGVDGIDLDEIAAAVPT